MGRRLWKFYKKNLNPAEIRLIQKVDIKEKGTEGF